MSYISPIKLEQIPQTEEGWAEQIGKYIAGEIDNLILKSCVKVGCCVDKDELEKALRYDRDQYAKGYADGKRDAAQRWHRVEDELPKDDCEVFTASRLPFDETDTWLYEFSYFTTDVSKCEELKDEYPNEHKAAFYKWSDISDKYVVCHYGLKYWMPIEPPKEEV